MILIKTIDNPQMTDAKTTQKLQIPSNNWSDKLIKNKPSSQNNETAKQTLNINAKIYRQQKSKSRRLKSRH